MRRSEHPVFVDEHTAAHSVVAAADVHSKVHLPRNRMRRSGAAADDALNLRVDKLAA